MLILYAGMKYDYGDESAGLSFEHYNFYDTLVRMGHDMLYFDFMSLLKRHGRAAMNQQLEELCRTEKPAMLFTFLFMDEFKRGTIRRISDRGEVATFNWFSDDHFRFDIFSRRWAPCFHWVSTTSSGALPKYERIGYRNVIKSQWAANPFVYRRLGKEMAYDVTFVGQAHGNRRGMVEALREVGIGVRTWGQFWDDGRISQEGMIDVFNRSRINLNFSNSSAPDPSWRWRARQAMGKALAQVPLGRQLKSVAKRLLRRAAPPPSVSPLGLDQTAENYAGLRLLPQIKGRNFEVPACGGMMLTGAAENLETYYRVGEEIDVFRTAGELVDKVRYYLAQEARRTAIAEAGYRRTMSEHTYVHRFSDIFRRMGLAADAASAERVLTGEVAPGQTTEIT
ncbi:MAG: CgeB family protein [Tepidisphaeraceae bacterium]